MSWITALTSSRNSHTRSIAQKRKIAERMFGAAYGNSWKNHTSPNRDG